MAEPNADVPELSPQFIHVMRTTQQIHLQLSQMADQKASILMGATFVIFTITVGHTANGGMPPLPLTILGGFAFISAVLAVSVLLPALGNGKGPLNLLFFGSFVDLEEAEYVERLRICVSTDPGAFDLMARDIYQNGTVLRRKKYRLLGYAYRVFLVGLVLSFLAFGWTLLANGGLT